jgi:hypothetical protein
MKTKHLLAFISFLSLLSFIMSCEENALILGAEGGNPNEIFNRCYWKPHIVDQQGISEEILWSAPIYNTLYDFEVTTTREGKENIKHYSDYIQQYLYDDEGWEIEDIGILRLVNINDLYNFLKYEVYKYYEGDKEQVINDAMAVLDDWLVDTPNAAPQQGQYAERIIIYIFDALFSTDYENGPRFDVITKAEYRPYSKITDPEYGSAFRIQWDNLEVFEYDRVIAGENPDPISFGNFMLTYSKSKTYHDY